MTGPLVDATEPGDLVARIEVQPRLLAVPYLGALIRRLCGPAAVVPTRPGDPPSEIDTLAADVVSMVERTIVEGARHDATAPVRLDLIGGARPRLVIVFGVAPSSRLGAEISQRAVTFGREATAGALGDDVAVIIPLPAAGFAARPEAWRR